MDIYENPQSSVAALIDHTLLKPEASKSDIARLCAEARDNLFASVCVNPCWVIFARGELQDYPVKICTVIGFPLGANHSAVKLAEAKRALADGATELDMVQNVGALRSGETEQVRAEISEIVKLAHGSGVLVKVILETCLLNEAEKILACQLAAQARADFVKTSTGFSTGGATVDDVRLMKEAVGHSLGIKASGGVRTLAGLRAMVYAGASRIGTSSGVAILHELQLGKQQLGQQLGPTGPASY